MKYISAKKWASYLNISVYEFNEYLEELGYLIRASRTPNAIKPSWNLTNEGMRHVKFPLFLAGQYFKWDFKAFFDVFQLKGEKTGEYIHCGSCGAYLNRQDHFDSAKGVWKCVRCGCEERKSDCHYNGNKI